MIPEQFITWFQGFLDFNPDLKTLNEEQTKRLKDKLSTVFNKVTPNTNLPNIPKTNINPITCPEKYILLTYIPTFVPNDKTNDPYPW